MGTRTFLIRQSFVPLMRLGAILLLTGGLLPSLRGEDRVLDAAIPLQKPRKEPPRQGGPLDKVELRIWLPDNVPTLRGAIVNPFNTKAVEQKHWQEAVRLWDFAMIGANYFGVGAGDYATLKEALKDFARQSGHKEIEHLPLCFVGMSAGAGMSMKFAEAMPERTLAVAPVCLEVGPTSEATRKIPVLTIFGEKDGKQMQLLTDKLPLQRQDGARWAIAVQWGRGHEFAAANNLILPFFDQVIRKRYPRDQTPEKGPPKLLDYPEADGWLGEQDTWTTRRPAIHPAADFKGDRSKVCWLPNRQVACVWRAFVAKAPTLTIKAPAGLGDGQPFAPHSAGEPLVVSVEDRGGKPRKVELFDGDTLLGECASMPFEFKVAKLQPGVHSLIAVATYEKDEQSVSRPCTILVKAK